MSDPASQRSAPAATHARAAASAASSRPSAWLQRCRSPASAATTSPRWQRSRQTAPPSRGTSGPPPPNRQPDLEGPVNRVSHPMLAPNPSQHLESENPRRRNPSLRFSLPESHSNAGRGPSIPPPARLRDDEVGDQLL